MNRPEHSASTHHVSNRRQKHAAKKCIRPIRPALMKSASKSRIPTSCLPTFKYSDKHEESFSEVKSIVSSSSKRLQARNVKQNTSGESFSAERSSYHTNSDDSRANEKDSAFPSPGETKALKSTRSQLKPGSSGTNCRDLRASSRYSVTSCGNLGVSCGDSSRRKQDLGVSLEDDILTPKLSDPRKALDFATHSRREIVANYSTDSSRNLGATCSFLDGNKKDKSDVCTSMKEKLVTYRPSNEVQNQKSTLHNCSKRTIKEKKLRASNFALQTSLRDFRTSCPDLGVVPSDLDLGTQELRRASLQASTSSSSSSSLGLRESRGTRRRLSKGKSVRALLDSPDSKTPTCTGTSKIISLLTDNHDNLPNSMEEESHKHKDFSVTSLDDEIGNGRVTPPAIPDDSKKLLSTLLKPHQNLATLHVENRKNRVTAKRNHYKGMLARSM